MAKKLQSLRNRVLAKKVLYTEHLISSLFYEMEIFVLETI